MVLLLVFASAWPALTIAVLSWSFYHEMMLILRWLLQQIHEVPYCHPQPERNLCSED